MTTVLNVANCFIVQFFVLFCFVCLFACLFFFWLIHFQFFSHFFCFPFSLLSYSPYLHPLSPFPLLSTGKVWTSVLQETWKWNIDQLRDLAYFTTNFASKNWGRFFWNSSARIWSIFKMDTPMNGSVLAVLAAYQNNLVSSENDDVTSGSMSPDANVGKIRLLKRFLFVLNRPPSPPPRCMVALHNPKPDRSSFLKIM